MMQVDEFLQQTDDLIAAYYTRDTIQRTLAAFKQIAEAFKAVPGRKTLIWATGGFPFMIDDPLSFNRMGVDMVDEYEKTWRTLIAANVAVYPVDVVGLMNSYYTSTYNSASSSSSSSSSTSTSTSYGESRGFPMRSTTIPYDQRHEQQETMRSIASSTGGRACIDSNGLEKCFSDAVDDSRTYYMLGFYLQNGDSKAGWRKLKVKADVNGAHVRAREGFYVASPTEDTPANRRKQINDALLSPIAYTGVRLRVRPLTEASGPSNAAQAEKQSAKRNSSFIVTIAADNFSIDPTKTNTLDLEVAAVAFDGKGDPVSQDAHSVSLQLKAESLSTFNKTGLRIGEVLDLAPGKYQMKFAVRDNSTGQMGTVIIPYEAKAN